MRRQTNFDVVRTIGLDLPEVEEGTMYGAPALKVRGKFLACMASHKSAEPGSLVVRIGFEDREALRDLLRSSWRTVTSSAPKRRPGAKSRGSA